MISFKILKFILALCLIININASCLPGQYKCSYSYSNGCCDCPSGTYSPDGFECINCPPGTYSSFSGSKSCNYCEPGSFTNIPGSSFCMRCNAGTHAPDYGSSFCYDCPYGAWSNPGSSHCYQMHYNYDYNYYYR